MKLSSIILLLGTFTLSLCSKTSESSEKELVNYIGIIPTAQLLEFDGLLQTYESTFDTDCGKYFTSIGFNYNGLNGENSLNLEITSNDEGIQDGTYSFINSECDYVDITFFHSDLLSFNEDAYFKDGTITVSGNESVFKITGRLFKLDENDLESFIGDAEGLIVKR